MARDRVRLDWAGNASGRPQMQEIAGSVFELEADLVLLAMGFVGPRREGMIDRAGVALNGRSNVAANTDDYATSAGSGEL